MRTLIVMRGGIGSGKSTFIKEKGLSKFTLCPDDLRLLIQAPELNETGEFNISKKNENKTWNLLKEILKKRMMNGDLTVIDATHTRAKDLTNYKNLANEYRYRVVCVDFSDVPLETLLERNKNRESHKISSDEIVELFYNRIKSSKIPSWVKTIKPDEFDDFFKYTPIDLSTYKKIHHIGDIHGCADTLMSYLKDGIKDDEFYIFVGDYIDRGIQNGKTIDFLFTLMNRKNVVFLEGNHEIHLHNWANDKPSFSKEFKMFTQKDLDTYGVSKKTTRMFYRSLRQCMYYIYNDKKVLVTHGGLTSIPDNLMEVSTNQLIKGVGEYSTEVGELFIKNSKPDEYQIHGHRNIQCHPIKVNERNFNLEGKIEQGGYLRIVTLNEAGFEPIQIKNNTFNERFKTEPQSDIQFGNEKLLEQLTSNRYIQEKEQKEKNISSFNFTREAFYDKAWNEQTVRARGLFINKESTEIVIRGYQKFFNVGETNETELENLKSNLIFPVRSYLKENGFLGLMGYDTQSDTMLISSKAFTSGPFKENFEDIVFETIPEKILISMKKYMRDKNVSFLFEVNDPIKDPHMIEYEKPHIVLLDIVYRKPEFEKYSYEELIEAGKEFDLPVKQLLCEFKNWEEFNTWYTKVSDDFELKLEGYVIEDSNGFMTKIKLPFYSFWKWMRTVKDRVAKGKEISMEVLNNSLANDFVKWLQNIEDKQSILDKDIITLRKEFEKERS